MIINSDWSAPKQVHAKMLTLIDQFEYVKYDAKSISQFNRALIKKYNLKHLNYLNQVHGNAVYHANNELLTNLPMADAIITKHPGQALALQSADCLIVLVSNLSGTEIAAVHAGWRGILANVIGQTFKNLALSGENYSAWCSPAICAKHLLVGHEVWQAFNSEQPNLIRFIRPANKLKHWYLDIRAMAHWQLNQAGVEQIRHDQRCTHHDTNFYSYRRNKTTKRMISLIWMDAP